MPRTPDRFPGEREDEGILLEDALVDPPAIGGIRRVGNDIRARDGDGVFRVRGNELTEPEHDALDSLTHQLSEDSYTEVVRVAGRIVNIIVWETAGKLKKVRETNINRVGGQVSVVVLKQFDATGTLKTTLTHTYSRAGGLISSVSTVKS